jgi:hypothetical protein
VRVRRRLGEAEHRRVAGVGPEQDRVPLVPRPRGEQGCQPLPQLRPAALVGALRAAHVLVEADEVAAAGRRTAARSSRWRRTVRRRTRRRRRSALRCPACWCRARRTRCPCGRKPHIIVIRAAEPSTIAASTTCPTPEPLRLEQPADHPERQQHSAAAEVAHEVDRGRRLLARPAEVLEHPGERDVVDVVAGGRGVRPVLPPPGHPAEHERGLRSWHTSGPIPAARQPPGGTPRRARRPGRPGPGAWRRPRVDFRSRAIERRPRLNTSGGGAVRVTTPHRAGTVDADDVGPMSDSIIAANGPGPIPATSMTVVPSRGPGTGDLLRCRAGLAAYAARPTSSRWTTPTTAP